MAMKPPKTLVLFNYDWDRTATQAIAHHWPHVNAGFDLFSFPSNARLAWFDMDRFCSVMAWKAKLCGATGVMSNHEQFGALCAALLAEKMGWPGTPVSAVLACQHKLYARHILDEVAPEANTPHQRLDAHYGGPVPTGLPYPLYVKPVKAAFSVLAAEVADEASLFKHTRFSAWELWVIRHLVQPFEKVIRQRLPEAGTAHSLMLEKPVKARQYCLDGYVFNGKLKTLGVVDAVMYPGTDAFMRFDFPSRLSASVQERAADVARRFLHRIGFNHGLFNMEFFHDEHTDTLTVIEFNPRMAAQFSDLYARVRGINLHDIAFALAHGMDPAGLPLSAPTAGTASSFVYRSFDPANRPTMPSGQQQQAVQREFPDSLLFTFPKDAAEIARDFKWLRSYRYGILHLGGVDALDLKRRCERASALLGWPAPYAGELSERELMEPLAHTTFEMELATG